MVRKKEELAVQLEISHGLAVITLNRPRVYNAFDLALGDALVDALISCDEDRCVRAVLVTGNGPGISGGLVSDRDEGVRCDLGRGLGSCQEINCEGDAEQPRNSDGA